jgi:hypothetical protein
MDQERKGYIITQYIAKCLNEWVRKSIRLAESEGYLDKLSSIYPATTLPVRPLNNQLRDKIRLLHKNGDLEGLLKLLLELTKKKHPFPIEHPYASIFRQNPGLIEKNPRVFQELGRVILSMSVEDVIKGVERPTDINRVMGQAFYKWLRNHFSNQGIPILPEPQFTSYTGNTLFDGRNSDILTYVTRTLKLQLVRGRDFLYKTKSGRFVIGEARFLSTSGGSQNRDLNETIEFIRHTKGKVIGVGVLDGIVWFNRRYVDMLSSLEDDEPALTVLLLEDFLNSLG